MTAAIFSGDALSSPSSPISWSSTPPDHLLFIIHPWLSPFKAWITITGSLTHQEQDNHDLHHDAANVFLVKKVNDDRANETMIHKMIIFGLK